MRTAPKDKLPRAKNHAESGFRFRRLTFRQRVLNILRDLVISLISILLMVLSNCSI